MEKILSIIASTPLFENLGKRELQKVRNISVDKFYARGKTIFTEGDDGNGFYIVADGRVKIFKVSMEGKEQILHIYGPGNPFGEVPVFAGGKFPAHAQAILKSHILFFPRDAFSRLIADNPSLSMNMLAVLSMRLRQFTVQIEDLSLKEVPGRLASHIIYLAETQENQHMVTLQISKGQLASLLGTTPETLSRILTKMGRLNLIKVRGKEILIEDHAGLKDLSENGRL